NLVGELVLGRNQLNQLASVDEASVFAKPVQHLNRVTTDLQEAVMRTRMQPIGTAWSKMPRLVRDLAQSSGKTIALEMHGQDTELDRQILQAISDPLTHMVRNSADHGIESPEARRFAGKPERGVIQLNAFHEGGHVILEITDDGAGIDVERVRQKAVERGLVKADALSNLTEAQILRFVFEPGFSTAERITNVSGRGVGMDVVRSSIEKIGGTVELLSKKGKGSTIRIKIPLTLAIVSALLVGVANEVFAIPQIGVIELVRVTEEQRGKIEVLHGSRYFRLRDSLLPLVSLTSTLKLAAIDECADYNIIVCQLGAARFGLTVDEVFDTQEIVVKPVGRLVKHLTAYAGCTILGDGRVIMILDTTGVANASLDLTTDARAVDALVKANDKEDRATLQRESVLLFDGGYEVMQAVPLSLIARLEEIPSADIAFAGGRFLVEYRGGLLPLVPVNPAMDMRAKVMRPVLVFSDGDRSMGLAVEEIHDIVEEQLRFEGHGHRTGVLGVCTIAGRISEIIDSDHYVRQAHPKWVVAQDVKEFQKLTHGTQDKAA
ncbi:MAG: chemotaxis protein CheA, partial [Phycisphaerae bacterium]|nr:chemotaxis protein CheA [Gemmatimonadaceae bacterium]